MSEFSQEVPESYKIAGLEHKGRFVSPVKNTHRKEQYVYKDGEREYPRILKFLPLHSAHSEVIGSAVFKELGFRTPETFYVEEDSKPAVIMEDLTPDFVADLTYGEGGVMADAKLRSEFQNTILAAILIGDYDRVPWNTLIKRDFSGVAHVDFGACCGSRAQGGYNGFSDSIDIEDIRHVIADPYDLTKITNTAYAEMIDISSGEVKILMPDKIKKLVTGIQSLTDDKINSIVDLSGWPDNSTEMGHELNKNFLFTTIAKLQEDLTYFKNPKTSDHIKTKRALSTFTKIIDDFNYDISAYFKYALKGRRDSIVKIFK